MDWARAIERNSEALREIVDTLFAMLGFVGDATVSRIPPPLHRAVLRVLRPAESAVRRLIVIAARGVVVKLAPSRPKLAASRPKPVGAIGKGGGSRPPSFQLFDPQKRFVRLPRRHLPKIRRNPPRIHVFPYDTLKPACPPVAAPVSPPDGLVGAERLSRRLQALKSALDDLPRQAKRLVRLQERRKASPWPKSTMPLWPGRPPGYRKKAIHPIDEVLAECHWLAWEALKPDTS